MSIDLASQPVFTSVPTKICFRAARAPLAQASYEKLVAQYGNVALEEAEVVVCLGGDGFLLETLHKGTALSSADLRHQLRVCRLPFEPTQ